MLYSKQNSEAAQRAIGIYLSVVAVFVMMKRSVQSLSMSSVERTAFISQVLYSILRSIEQNFCSTLLSSTGKSTVLQPTNTKAKFRKNQRAGNIPVIHDTWEEYVLLSQFGDTQLCRPRAYKPISNAARDKFLLTADWLFPCGC